MRCVLAALLAVSFSAGACDYPDEGNLPLRRAATRVKMLPDTHAWTSEVHKTGAVVHYAVLLERTVLAGGRCHWTVEVSADGKLWQRFYVSPDGESVLAEGPGGKPLGLAEWRAGAR